MKAKELRKQVDAYRDHMQKINGKMLIASGDGPLGKMLDAIVQTVEQQEARLDALERMAAGGK